MIADAFLTEAVHAFLCVYDCSDEFLKAFLTWKVTRLDREHPFFYDNHESQSPPNKALFVILRTGKVVEVSSSVSSQEHIELVDTGGSPECLAIEVAESYPPVPPTLSIA
ncbi:hypothetical protein LIER_18750 [Lithospermum erythrorhizon]|uniref:Uncharacterized protein n=1 Tax=Lithospermum erythrorhizon TaxID=34254 RepID=A0AAV3QHS5_LITER